ncbi:MULTISPECIES: prephenate dehydratase [Thermodesulfovibrio]|uniref:Bifunctional chorismate mutase/prephenate dehydratase n=2 Tax=Thermodesulfovibrio yellowstonii TaxID=28262 RepID=B5YH64_THEYD|nr:MULTISPECIES: prephenate dehydratase [Thermodesulfovibrio]ACI22155.1 P-protein [Thermodesulfovibrio yellowstonii DSM 11347]MDI6865571.1 prephenate dehydratase [Thermodesulfovibrio yellowstonii]GLI52866.1 prephenate dehydratase [Thermodesulfovibrio islandicus]
MENEKLQNLRDKIDKIDKEILKLLNDRAKLAIKIAEIKKTQGLSFYDPVREKNIINKILKLNKGPFSDEVIKTLFREILSATLALQESQKISYLGPEGTFTHLAAIKYFGSFAQFEPEDNIKNIFESVEKGITKFGVVPIENSNEGTVTYTLDMFMQYEVKIAGEIIIPITHNLLSLTGEKEKIKKIYSHPHARAQCREWLRKNMPDIPVYDVASTAEAARQASLDEDVAAIASEFAANIYGLKFVAKHIEDYKNNYTRFFILGKTFPNKTGSDKTSIMFSLQDKPGTLYNALKPFKDSGLNLTKIESRPAKMRKWEYIFFVDFMGHIEDEKVRKTLEEVKNYCIELVHLGSYPMFK